MIHPEIWKVKLRFGKEETCRTAVGACPGNFEFWSGMKANNRNGNFANEK
jgi:hypothetical protein